MAALRRRTGVLTDGEQKTKQKDQQRATFMMKIYELDETRTYMK